MDNLKEKFIEEYEDIYTIDIYGNVYSKYTNKYLKPAIKSGYLFVELYKNKKPKQYLIHRLVAKAFIDNKENKPEVNHKDGNKLNNDINNLEWNTSSENSQHAWDTGLQIVTETKRKASSENGKKYGAKNAIKAQLANMKKTLCITSGSTFDSIKEAVSSKEATSESALGLCLQGKRKTHNKKEWRFL